MPNEKITQTAKARNEKFATKRTDFTDSKSIKNMFSKRIINHLEFGKFLKNTV